MATTHLEASARDVLTRHLPELRDRLLGDAHARADLDDFDVTALPKGNGTLTVTIRAREDDPARTHAVATCDLVPTSEDGRLTYRDTALEFLTGGI
ncbi:hypothetical protein [Deinococcus pimensis]|uniref:hypothetical protein n=1 Tax=Deinococcus pimensis TaxID=309888 RepID=UPI00048577CC|nr:hypothetical protein [Deinococcus pimensis]